MAVPLRTFLDSALPPNGQNTWLRELVEKEIEARNDYLGFDDLQNSGCLLEDIGTLLIKTSSLLSDLAVSLAEGQHIKDYSNLRIEQIEQQNDFSELGLLDYLETKHISLRLLAANFQSATENARRVWGDGPVSPFGDLETQQVWNDLNPRPGSMASGEELWKMLGTRGKGQWLCTQGIACTKGGVSPDGQIVVFERNSTFKLSAHAETREKVQM
ncbi:MAG: hypothetical protein Q9195_005941 [Heterodermia aff. obscurata]